MRASDRYHRYEVDDRQLPGFRVFVVAMSFGVIGAIVFGIGVAGVFGRGGSWADLVAMVGVGVLVFAGVTNLIAAFLGLRVMIRRRAFVWWPAVSLVLASGFLWLLLI